MNEIDDLKRDVADRQRRIRELESEAERVTAEGLVGKCFKSRNSYSCPEPDEFWWLYARVVSTDRFGSLEVIHFEVDHRGDCFIRRVARPAAMFSSGPYSEIGEGEFRTAWAAFDDRIAALKIVAQT